MIYRYAGISADGQSMAAQVAALNDAGAGKVFREVASCEARNWLKVGESPRTIGQSYGERRSTIERLGP